MLTYNAKIKKRNKFVKIKRFYVQAKYSIKHIN